MASVSNSSLVYNVDIFILVVIFIFALFSAPRAVVRLARSSERFQGILLRSITLSRKPRMNLNTNSVYLHSNPEKSVLNIDEGSTESFSHLQNLAYLPSHPGSGFSEKPLPQPVTVPVHVSSSNSSLHVPMLSSLMQPVASFLELRVHENYSLGQVLLMLGYTIVMFYAGLYMSSPFVDFNRTGWLSTSQLPFIYILATKNNAIGMLVGMGYEKLNYLHRLAGLLAVTAANIHGVGYIYQWSLAGEISTKLSQPYIAWGIVALVCFDMLAFFSVQFVRAKFYNLFLATHAVGLIVVLFALCYHRDDCVPYVIVATVFYGLDHLARVIKTRITTATLRPIPELGLTRVELPSINAGWRAGQHVRLRVLSSAMGIWGMTEVHPFTIANVSKTEEGLVLMCKKAGRWTSRMYEISNTPSYGEQGRQVGRDVTVMVEGPYGGVGNTVVSSYSGAMFVVGGSGVTFALSAVQDLVRLGNDSNVTDIEIVWSLTDPTALMPMVPLFTALISQCNAARLRVSVFYTRAPTKQFDGMYLPPGITLAPGRPKLGKHLDALVSGAISAGGASGVFVGVCGPVSLAGSVAQTVRDFDKVLKKTVGGIEFHEEVFGW